MALKISENIALEREDLVKELDLLRTLNTKMLDEKDTNELNQMKMKPPDSLPVDPCYTQWRSLDNALHNQASDQDQERLKLPAGKCTSLKPLSPQEEKIILMESQGEDLRRLRQMKPIVNNAEAEMETAPHRVLSSQSHSFPLQTHKRRRHKAYRQSSNDNVSLYEELALSNSIEEDPLPELCLDHVMDSDEDEEDTETSLSQVCSI